MNYYPFHIGDYAVHTRHLSLIEDLAYRRLLDLYYTRESALPAEAAQVARLLGMRDQAAEVQTVLEEFFALGDSGWTHARCDAEIAKASRAAETARANGSKGGRPPKAVPHEPADNPAETQRVPSDIPAETGLKAPITQDPLPKPNTSLRSVERAPRASRTCPDSFEVDGEMRQWAAGEAPGVSVDRETAKFRDHTFKTAHSDWLKAWRNWMRRASEGMGPAARASPQQETPYQRSQREDVERFAPGIARRAPTPSNVVDVPGLEIFDVPALARG